MNSTLRPEPDTTAGIDHMVWQSELARVGAFRCPTSDPLFRDTGPIRNHSVVFPRTSSRIAPMGHRAFVADRSIVPLYNPDQEYLRQAVDPTGDRCDYFSAAPHVVHDILRARDPRAGERGFRVSHVRSSAALYLRQRTLFRRAAAASAGDAFEIEEQIVSLLDDVVRQTPGVVLSRRLRTEHLDLADRVREVLAREFAAPLSLGDLARAVDVSAFHLCRVFRAVTGSTLHQHREHLRLSAALERIEEGDDLTSVALDVGYSSHSHFSASFRRAFGTTPSEYRGHSPSA
jgi:AraC-like DNA-binding protein